MEWKKQCIDWPMDDTMDLELDLATMKPNAQILCKSNSEIRSYYIKLIILIILYFLVLINFNFLCFVMWRASGQLCKRPSPQFPWVLEWVFGGGMPFHANQFGLGKRHRNLQTSSVVVEFLPLYLHKCLINKWNLLEIIGYEISSHEFYGKIIYFDDCSYLFNHPQEVSKTYFQVPVSNSFF